MSTPAVGSSTTATNKSTTTTDRGLSSMKSEDFFKLLVTELKQQDPFEPAKTADMINQVSQIRSIELSRNLTDALTQMNQQQHMAGASDLLGKYVTAKVKASDGSTSEVSGIVTGVKFADDGSAVLELDTGQTVSLADVTKVAATDAAKASSTSQTKTATEKTSDTAKTKQGGLLPWLSLNGSFNL